MNGACDCWFCHSLFLHTLLSGPTVFHRQSVNISNIKNYINITKKEWEILFVIVTGLLQTRVIVIVTDTVYIISQLVLNRHLDK